MLKNLFTAGLLLCASLTMTLSMSANASLIKGIDGSFDVVGAGNTSVNADGEVTSVDFFFSMVLIFTGDYEDYFTSSSVLTIQNPLELNNIVGVDLWTIEGFTFTGTSIRENSTTGTSTGLYIIGDVSHADFITTESEWFFSTQGLVPNSTSFKSFSSTITSPAPSTVPEPGTVALFGLGLVFFGLRRYKKEL